jgi:acyl carrier protein
MTRDEVLAVVAKHLANAVEGVEASAVEGARSLKDYGANSLDIVEIVSGSMRELRIRVPRSKLNELKTIDGLVDLLYQNRAGSGDGA